MKNLFTLLLVCFAGMVMAQDKIYRTNGDVIECKVVEVGDKNVVYKQNNTEDAATITISKIDIIKIQFEDGSVMRIKPEETNEELYTLNRKRAWKLDFLSPLFGHTGFGFEQVIEPGMNHDATFGIIGLGFNNNVVPNVNNIQINSRPFGLYGKYGVKFLSPRTSIFDQQKRFKHLMDGSYIKPEAYLGFFSNEVIYSTIDDPNQFPPNVTYGKAKGTTLYGGLQLVAGVQKVYNNRFLFEYYAGIGYGFNNRNYNVPDGANVNEFDQRNSYGVVGGGDMRLSFSGGIRIGFLSN